MRRVEDAFGGGDVRVVHRRPLRGRDADPVAARAVDDRARAGHHRTDRVGRAEIARHEPDTEVAQRPGLRRIPDDRDDLVTALVELPRDAASR